MIDSATVLYLVGAYFGAWALGFGMGKSVAWMRAVGSVV